MKCFTILILIISIIIGLLLIDKYIPEDHIQIGNELFQMDKVKEAIEEYTKAIKENPKHGAAYNNRGLAYFQIKKINESIADYSKAIEIDPNNPSTHYNRGNLYTKINYRDQALEDFNNALKLNPYFEQAIVGRGGLYASLGKYKEAIEDFNTIIENPTNIDESVLTEAYYNRGNIQMVSGKFKEAINDFTKCIEFNPQDHTYYVNRASSYSAIEELDESIKDYTKALSLSKDNTMILNSRGLIYIRKNLLDLAEEDFKISNKISPNAQAYFGKALILIQKKDKEEALIELSNALFIDPSLVDALYHRSIIFYEKGDYHNSALDLTVVLNKQKNFARAYLQRAWALEKLDKIKEASFDFKKAFDLNPKLKELIKDQ